MKSEISEIFIGNDIKLFKLGLSGGIAQAAEIRVPQKELWIVAVRCKNGMLGCRLFDLEMADKLGLPLAVFAAANTVALLEAKPVSLSAAAQSMGANREMTGAEIAELFS